MSFDWESEAPIWNPNSEISLKHLIWDSQIENSEFEIQNLKHLFAAIGRQKQRTHS